LGYTQVTVNGDSFIGSIRELKVGEYKRSASATCRNPSCPGSIVLFKVRSYLIFIINPQAIRTEIKRGKTAIRDL
jgi:hypothetical protein